MVGTRERVPQIQLHDPAARVVLANSAVSGGGTVVLPADLALISVWEAVSDVNSWVVAFSRI